MRGPPSLTSSSQPLLFTSQPVPEEAPAEFEPAYLPLQFDARSPSSATCRVAHGTRCTLSRCDPRTFPDWRGAVVGVDADRVQTRYRVYRGRTSVRIGAQSEASTPDRAQSHFYDLCSISHAGTTGASPERGRRSQKSNCGRAPWCLSESDRPTRHARRSLLIE